MINNSYCVLKRFRYYFRIIVVLFITASSCRQIRLWASEKQSDFDELKIDTKSAELSERSKSQLLKSVDPQDLFIHSTPSTLYASPSGLGDGSSENNPASFELAIRSGHVIPGDTILLLDSIYKGVFQITIMGTQDQPIIIKPLNDYKALIDGGLIIGDLHGEKGSHIVIRDFQITNSDTWRGTWLTVQGSIERAPSINVQAPYVSIINNFIHDGGVGVCGYSAARECLVYGNIIWNSGWADDVHGGAQNIYMHSSTKTIRHNVFAGAFKRSVQLHGNHGALTESTVSENVAICKESFLVGSYNVPNHDIVIDGNHILGWAEIGYVYDPNDNVTVSRNIIYSQSYSGIRFLRWKNINFQGNKIIKPSNLSVDIFLPSDDSAEIATYNIDRNQYYQLPQGYKTPFEIRKHKAISFSDWQKEGYDINGFFKYNFPEANETYVYPNEYPGDKRMGIVVIWNWEALDNVAVSLKELGLVEGETYLWRNAQDPLGDISTWTYYGKQYLFPMIERTVAYPIGFNELLLPNQFPLFGCFIIERL